MNILFLSQVLPFPLDAGPKTRSYYVLRYLSQRHDVTLLTFVRVSDKAASVAHLETFCRAVHTVPMHRTTIKDLLQLTRSFSSGEPFLIVRDQIPAYRQKMAELVRNGNFDVIHADQLWMAQYALPHQHRCKIILDQHNAVHLVPKRLADGEANPVKRQILKREAKLMKRYEIDICQQFDQTVWVTKEDKATMPASSVDPVIPICADPSQIQPYSVKNDSKNITFLGGLHWPPNAQGILWFANDVFPLVRKKIPDATLTVIGKNPPPELQGAGIRAIGYAPTLTSYLEDTAVFVVPLLAGGGMRVKILDAWQWGLPIVSTDIGAEGIDATHNHDALLANTPAEFAQATLQLLKNPKLREKLRRNGRKTVSQKYDWRKIYPAWEDVYQKMAPSPQLLQSTIEAPISREAALVS